MVDMPRPEPTRFHQIKDYALGILHETAWILGMTVFAYLMALAAMAVFK